ncbi:hypothetical protein [Sphingobacterium faecium]|uniref:hypothetical protein n=1 Tax=Sphingobacterium faecium TaxID=34087 RepID=UPI000D4E8550|nr:hypothetical protein [Sphingobacterium faecium]MQP28786.1 hypothetical protein [Sphingobacterium faecium]PTX12960.1 hypothetical protein C8N37_102666 [Sphingobacterium faecium]
MQKLDHFLAGSDPFLRRRDYIFLRSKAIFTRSNSFLKRLSSLFGFIVDSLKEGPLCLKELTPSFTHRGTSSLYAIPSY